VNQKDSVYLINPAINYKLKAVQIFEGEMYSKYSKYMTMKLKCINVNDKPAISTNFRNSAHFDMHIKLMQKTIVLRGIKIPQIYLKKKYYCEMNT